MCFFKQHRQLIIIKNYTRNKKKNIILFISTKYNYNFRKYKKKKIKFQKTL